MDDERLNKIKVLTPVETVDEKKVIQLIREHEKRFLYEETPKIIITPLLTKQDFKRFVKQKEFTDYKQKKDQDWAAHYNIKKIGIMFTMNMRKVGGIAKHQTKAAYNILRKRNFPITAIQNMTAIVSWHLTGYVAYETWAWGENPYEPTADLIEMGFVPRRLNDYWLVGYVPKEIKLKVIGNDNMENI